MGQWPPLSGFVSLQVKWQRGGLAGSTVTCCDAFSPPMGLALTSYHHHPRHHPGHFQVYARWLELTPGGSVPRCPRRAVQSWQLKGPARSFREQWQNMRWREPGQNWGRNEPFFFLEGFFPTLPSLEAQASASCPLPMPTTRGQKGEVLRVGVTSHLTAPNLSLLIFKMR